MDKAKIQPLKGFRDFLPGEQKARQKVFGKIRAVFERYGFLPMSTPVLEYKEILAGKYGEEGDKLMYEFVDRGGREVAMRYDLTVPLARFIAQYKNELAMPFKRYQIDPVWRADKPQKGRWREFYQCDVDVAGSSSITADAEVIACLDAAMADLGIKDRVIRINNRKLLSGIMKEAGVEEKKAGAVIRILDKLERDGEQAVRGYLAGEGIQTETADKLFGLINQDLQDAKDLLSKFEGIDGAGELAELLEILLLMGVKNYQADMTLARGIDYYTGTIFEIVLPDAPDFGSVAGGGRYDNLLGMFLTSPNPSSRGGEKGEVPSRGGEKREVPAVGGSIGIDRLLSALEELELIKYDLVFDVLVANLDESLSSRYLEIAKKLREAGIKTDLYYESDKLEKQLKYADKKNIDYAVLVGTDEEAAGEAAVKNMKTGTQEKVKQSKLAEYLEK